MAYSRLLLVPQQQRTAPTLVRCALAAVSSSSSSCSRVGTGAAVVSRRTHECRIRTVAVVGWKSHQMYKERLHWLASKLAEGLPQAPPVGFALHNIKSTDDATPRKQTSQAAATKHHLVALDNDTLIRCASYLNVDGLAQLGRTSAGFGIPQPQHSQQRSLVNEAARQQFRQSATNKERGRLPKYDDDSDIGLYRALEQLRRPLCFDELAGLGFSPQENPSCKCHIHHRPWRFVGRLQCQGM